MTCRQIVINNNLIFDETPNNFKTQRNYEQNFAIQD